MDIILLCCEHESSNLKALINIMEVSLKKEK